MENSKVAISINFFTALNKLPKHIQNKVTDFMAKFINNPNSPGIHYEKLHGKSDQKIYSVRIDDTYRGIVVREQVSGVYILLWVDHHDEAYSWASSKKCDINEQTGAIQLYDVKNDFSVENTNHVAHLFDFVTDDELLKLAVPAEQLPYIRSFINEYDFRENKDSLPTDAYENLLWILEGISVDEVIKLFKEQNNSMKNIQSGNFADALEMPLSKKSYVVIDGEEELHKMIDSPLENWRIFLHPMQRNIIEKNYSGSARVLGSAGTGKTVVAMHRAKKLASSISDNDKILFTTFTANLAADIKENLKKICSLEEINKIDIINLDAWVSQFLKNESTNINIVYAEKLNSLWLEAIALARTSLNFDENFYIEEWNQIITAKKVNSLDDYMKVSRNGRGVRLNKKNRIAVWKVFEEYKEVMKKYNSYDINTAIDMCIGKLECRNEGVYKHIIVDEGQDFSNNSYCLLRKLAGDEHDNDIFIVGDSHQRIYKNCPILSKCGINIRGRSSILKINYRTTEEIRKYAISLLKGIEFDDLDNNICNDNMCQSLTHGEMPIIENFKNSELEFNYILKEIKRLKETGVHLSDICIVVRTKKLVEKYIEQFENSNFDTYRIRQNKVDDQKYSGIRIATMHRVKGLEFKYIFIASANEGVVPLSLAIDNTNDLTREESLKAEKCLLYVALTRAQKKVYITSYGKKSKLI